MLKEPTMTNPSTTTGDLTVSDHVYRLIQLTGTSSVSSDDAIRNAIARASNNIHHLRWFEVLETRGDIKDGEVRHWQVTIRVGFTLEE
jgi:flavin-binding protein dodecin